MMEKQLEPKKKVTVKSEEKLNDYLVFDKTRKYVRDLNLKSKNQWNNYRNSSARPSYIPKEPHSIYASQGWLNTDDWIGKEKKKNASQVLRSSCCN